MNHIEFLTKNANALAEKTCNLSDKIWDASEIAFSEEKSSQYLKDYLISEGFTVESGTAGLSTAFVAKYGSGRPYVGFLAEYDALSGLSQEANVAISQKREETENGHGCGHNLLGSGCALAGVLLKRYLEETGLSGTVLVYGCPAEEGGSGKTIMAGKGVFKDLDCAFSWHPGEVTTVVSVSTMANIQMIYRFKGKASHAATAPFQGRSALDAVELMNVGANYLREHIPNSCMFHYAVLNTGGVSPNVVQANAESTYLIRGARIEEAVAVKERIDNIARGAALMTDTEVDIIFKKACSHYLPNGTMGELVSNAVKEVGVPVFDEKDIEFAKAIRETTPSKEESTGILRDLVSRFVPAAMLPTVEKAFEADINTFCIPYVKVSKNVPGSSDVGDVSLNCPAVWLNYVTCAQGTPGHSWQMTAQGKCGIAYKGMLQAAKVLALSGIKIIEDPSIAEKAKAEHQKDMNGKSYVCPIPN